LFKRGIFKQSKPTAPHFRGKIVMASITGDTLNNLLLSTSANDTITGGSGVDTASFSGQLTDYSLTAGSDTLLKNYLLISNASVDGSDTVKADIEILRFLDSSSASPTTKLLAVSQEAIANGFTEDDQNTTNLLALSDGSFINFWLSPDGYYFRKFNADGTSLSLETKILDQEDDELSPDVTAAILKDGSFVLAWAGLDASGTGVYAQRFDSDGKSLGTKFRVNDTITDNQNKPAITALSDGGYVIAWESANQGDSIVNGVQVGDTPNTTGVFAQIFDSGSNPVGWEIDVSQSGGSDPFVTALAGGKFVAGYNGITGSIERMTVYANIYDGQGNVVSALKDATAPHADIADGTGTYDAYDAVDDQIVTALAGYVPATNEINYSIEPILEPAVTDDSAKNRDLGNTHRFESKAPTAATLENNNTVVVWQAPIDPYEVPALNFNLDYDFSIMLRLYNSTTGQALTQEIKANTFTLYDQRSPAVAALKSTSGTDGGFVVIWQSQLDVQSYKGCYGQRYDKVGVKVGTEFQVNTKVADSQKDPTVVALADGGFVVSWVAEYQDGNQQGKYQNGLSGTEIVMQRFDKDGNKLGLSVAGGSADDSLSVGGADPFSLDGAAGNDTLTSGDDIDTLRGGDGADILDGGQANDFLFGGTGDDSIIAGSGNDTIDGGKGTDTLSLLGSKNDYELDRIGNAYVITALSGTEGTDTLLNIEILKFAVKVDANDLGITSLSSFGSTTAGSVVPGIEVSDTNLAQANVLTGTAQGDTLTGGNTKGAADTLQGDASDDLYIALGNSLIIYDTEGTDTLQTGLSNIDLSKPLTSKIKGLQYIENVELTGKKALKLIGSDADNALLGNDGSNLISGGIGNDTILGGAGKDKLTGGADEDVFIFKDPLIAGNVDLITDFVSEEDKIRLSTAFFKDIDPDEDGVINFLSGAGIKSAQTDTAAFIVYNSKNGNLYYDGIGTKAVLFAKLAGIASTTSSSDTGTSTTTNTDSLPGIASSGSSWSSSSSTSSSSGSTTTTTTLVGTKTFPDLLVSDFDLFL
jgi:hypothetical protein